MEFLQRLTEENVEQLLEFLRVKSFGRDLTLALTALGLVLKVPDFFRRLKYQSPSQSDSSYSSLDF